MTVKKRGGHWHYDFSVKGRRYREAIPLATNKAEALDAEASARSDVFKGTYGRQEMGNQLFSEFVDQHYLPWAKTNKRTWRNDQYIAAGLCETFRGKRLCDVGPLEIEKLKRNTLKSKTVHGGDRSPASVNMVLSVGSRIFSLAVDLEKAARNPFSKVKKLAVDNLQFRYLLWDEEAALLSVLENLAVKRTGRQSAATLKAMRTARAHLRDAVQVALGAGLRRSEQTRLKATHCDFSRNVIIVQQTKTNKRPREVPMSDDVRTVLLRLARGRKRDDYLFVNPNTSKPFVDYKNGFMRACADAGIENLTWRNLRDTFGTRLGEAGYNAFDIAALMGHSDIRTTQRYVKTEPRKHEAVQATMLSRRGGAA